MISFLTQNGKSQVLRRLEPVSDCKSDMSENNPLEMPGHILGAFCKSAFLPGCPAIKGQSSY